MLIGNHFPAKRWDRLPACRRLLFPFVSRATKEIGDVCTQAMGQVRRVQASLLTAGKMAMQPSFIILVQKRGQFSLRSVGLPCDTLLLVFIMTA